MKRVDLSVEFNRLNAQKLREHERITTFHAGQSDEGAESIGRMADANEYSKRNFKITREEEKRTRNRILRQLEEHRRWLLETMEKVQDRIDELTALMDEHARNIEVLEEAIEQYQNTGQFELGDDGYPTDERLKRLIKDFEARTGRPWNPDNENAIEQLQSMLDSEMREFAHLNQERSDKHTEWDQLHEQYQANEENIRQYRESGYVPQEKLDLIEDLNANSSSEQPEFSEASFDLNDLPNFQP